MTPEELEYIRTGKYPQKENTPPITPPKEKEEFKYNANRRLIDDKKAELELIKLEKEIERIENQGAPQQDAAMQLIKVQGEYFEKLMAKEREIADLKASLARAEVASGDNFEQDLIMELMPHLPAILKSRQNTSLAGVTLSNAAAPETTPSGAAVNNQGGLNVKTPSKEVVEAYIKKIKAGEITKEQFFEDALRDYPQLAKLASREQIYQEYEKLKNSP